MNENSLKRLNGYLENLQKHGSRSLQPMKLTFYVRDTKDNSDMQPDLLVPGNISINIAHYIFLSSVFRNQKCPSWFSGFRSVSFTLQTQDVLSTVINVLKSCSLSVEHMKGLRASAETPTNPREAGLPFYKPIKWDKSYYIFTGFRDPEQELQQARTIEPSLRLARLTFTELLHRYNIYTYAYIICLLVWTWM